jgi:hypothetical protein
MKRLLYLGLIFSAALALGAWRPWRWSSVLAAEATAKPAAGAVHRSAPARAASTPLLATNQPLPAATVWASLDSPDPARLIANLRGVGCPEQTIRDLVTFRVCRRYHERLLDAERQRIISRDPTRSGSANSGDVLRDQLFGLRNARDRKLEALFGVSARKLTESVFVFLDYPRPGENDDPLPPAKRAEVRDIEERYRRLIVEARHGLAFNGPDASVDAAIGELSRQKEAELASALSPQELDALRLRESPAARYVLKYLPEAQSEAEFRLMVQAAVEAGIEAPEMSLARMMPFRFPGSLLPLDTEDEDRQQAGKIAELKGRLRQLLGEQRMADLELEMQTQPPVENPFNIRLFK